MPLKPDLSEAEQILLQILQADPTGVENIIARRWHTLVDHPPSQRLQDALIKAKKLLYPLPPDKPEEV